MKSTKMLEDFKTHNIQHIYVYCVDNILVKIADPVFIGYCASQQLDCANKVIGKGFLVKLLGHSLFWASKN